MKKLISLILTFAMLFSLAMPAMAAEITGNTDTPTEGDVTATYNPDIAFTGVEVTSDFALIDKGNGNYIAVIAPGDTGADITFKYVGKNLEYLTADNTLLKAREDSSDFGEFEYILGDIIEFGFTGTAGSKDGSWWEMEYSNDGGNSWSGVHVDFKQGYTITDATTDENGSITAPEYSVAGETVTLNVFPVDGYELDALTVMNGETPVEVSNNSFTMPAGDVTVSATFKEKVAVQKYKIEILKPDTDSDTTVTGTVTSDVSEAAEGDTVQLTAIPAEDYKLQRVVVIYTVPTDTGYKDVYMDVNNDLSFTMPAYDVRVKSYFEPVVIEPKITSLDVTIDGVKYDSSNTSAENPAIIYSDSTYSVNVTGTDFDKLDMSQGTNNPSVKYAKGYAAFVSPDWTVDASLNTATYTITSMNPLKDTSTAFEIGYASKEDAINGSSERNYHGSGVYIVYVDSKKPVYYNVTIADGITGGTVSVDKTTAKQGETVTVTVAPADGYQIGTVTVKDAEDNIVEFTETGAASGVYKFTMPASAVTVTASFEKLSTTSADIAWGSMSFTYTDGENGAEGAWSNDVTGGGTVTVTNTGDTAFTANISYTAEAGYTEITGTFDAASAELKEDEEKTFTLTLKNKPEKAITAGTKIGSVTIVIVNDSGSSDSGSSDEDESDVTTVTTEQELIDAVAQGGKIKLGNDIALENKLIVESNVAIDLNGKTLSRSTGNVIYVNSGYTVSISNGNIVGSGGALENFGTVSVENCTLTTGETHALDNNNNGTLSLKDCTVNGLVTANSGTVTLYETITWGHSTSNEMCTGIWVTGGNVICHFDPDGHIFNGSVTNNNDGTWTVTAN